MVITESNLGDIGGADDAASLVIDDAERGLFRVHRSVFVSEQIFEQEQRRIFDKLWLYIGHESEVPCPGDFQTRTLARRPLIFLRDGNNTIRVFVNSCPHRGNIVCREPEGNKKIFQCSYHSWSFSNEGDVVRIPLDDAYSGDFCRDEMGLRSVPRVDSYRGFVFISFNADVEDLESHLAGQKQYLDQVADQSDQGMEVIEGRQLYSARANWKSLLENNYDQYHVQSLHVTYMKYLKDAGADLSNGIPGTNYALGNGHAASVFKGMWGRPVARWEPSWGEAKKAELEAARDRLVALHGEEKAALIADTDVNMVIFPNLMINDIMGTVIRQVNPISPGYMEITQQAFAPVGESPEDRALRIKSFLTFLGPAGLATPDDVEALESCQQGYEAFRELGWNDVSRYMAEETKSDAGPVDGELQLRAIWRRWRDLMEDA